MKYFAILFLTAAAFAQTTTVSGTVADPNGNPYANGTVSAFAVVSSGLASPPTLSGTLNGSGTFSIVLKSNFTYIFTVCAPPTNLGPRANPTPTQVCFSSQPIAVSGGAQDVGAALNSVAVVLGPSGSTGGGGGGGSAVVLNPSGTQTINQPGGSHFIIKVGGSTFWDLSAAVALFNTPVQINGGGPVNGINIPDSGVNCLNGTNNSMLICSGSTPVSEAIDPSGFFQPIVSVKDGGAVYNARLQTKAELGQPNGYAPLDGNALIPVAQLIQAAGLGGCSSANFVRGDFSSCASATSNPPFSNLTGGTNNTAAMLCTAPCSLSGQIDALTVRGATYPDSGALLGGLGVDNQALQTVGAGNVSGVALPDCLGNTFLQHDNTLHTFPCNAPAGSLAPIILKCNGANGACPDAAPFTGLGAVAILQSFSLSANTIATDRCMKFVAYVQHTVGTASTSYAFNIGGTGARGAAPTGGTTTPTGYATTSTSNFQRLDVDFCNGGTAGNYYRMNQMQTGNGQVTGASGTIGAVNWGVTNQINLTFNVANTDQIAFNGGYVTF